MSKEPGGVIEGRGVGTATTRPIASALVIGVDPGCVSGVAGVTVTNLGLKVAFLESFDMVKSPESIDTAAKLAVELARNLSLHPILVIEKHAAGGKFGGHRTMQGLAERRGVWLHAFARVGVVDVVKVYPATWLSRMFGKSSNIGREAVLTLAKREASTWTETPADDIAPDAAVAAVIALFGAGRCAEVQAFREKKARDVVRAARAGERKALEAARARLREKRHET